MSFGDIQGSKNAVNKQTTTSSFGQMNSQSEKDPVSNLRESIAALQKNCMAVKEKITDLRRKKVTHSDKNMLDLQIKELKQQENQIKLQFDRYNAQETNTTPLQRATLSKLFKDYERLKVSLEAIINESQLVKVNNAITSDSFSRTGNNSSANNAALYDETNKHDDNSIVINNGQQKLVLKPLVQAADVDEMIIEEREKEIAKLHEDLVRVQDMYKHMAEIVEEQGGHIDNIHKTTVESHQRAEAGLEQVKQAANYQPTCVIS